MTTVYPFNIYQIYQNAIDLTITLGCIWYHYFLSQVYMSICFTWTCPFSTAISCFWMVNNTWLCRLFTITTGASCVGRLLKNCSLQVLNVGRNSIGDDGISVMMNGLQHNKTLTELYVYKCGLSAKGTIWCKMQDGNHTYTWWIVLRMKISQMSEHNHISSSHELYNVV